MVAPIGSVIYYAGEQEFVRYLPGKVRDYEGAEATSSPMTTRFGLPPRGYLLEFPKPHVNHWINEPVSSCAGCDRLFISTEPDYLCYLCRHSR